MSTALWMNTPLMVLAFALWAGVPLWMELCRKYWSGEREARSGPAYGVRRPAPDQAAMVRVPRPVGYGGRCSMRR